MTHNYTKAVVPHQRMPSSHKHHCHKKNKNLILQKYKNARGVYIELFISIEVERVTLQYTHT